MFYYTHTKLFKLLSAAIPAALVLAITVGPKLREQVMPRTPPVVPLALSPRAAARPARLVPATTIPVPALARLEAQPSGSSVRLPLFSTVGVLAKVNLKDERDGVERIAGSLSGAGGGSFALAQSSAGIDGLITFPAQKRAYRVQGPTLSGARMQPLPLDEIECAGLPRMRNQPPRPARAPNAGAPIIPSLNSRPGAVAQLYLDFDGETVTDPLWNNGQTIVAPAYDLSSDEITAIFERVKEDYWPFNVNITTDLYRYTAAPVGKRMRVIITPNDAALPGMGGVAYLNSFAQAGKGQFSTDIPCWVFNSFASAIAEAISHELGHTFGLSHDGREIPTTGHEEYYEGQPSADGNLGTGWAPIMGSGYYRPVVQWSKGEYTNANNQEDDIAIISNAANGIGLVADEAGGSPASAAVLQVTSTQVNQTGIITSSADADYYQFNSAGQAVTFSAASTAGVSPNLDIALEIRDGSDQVLASSRPVDTLSASLTATLPGGTYYLVVTGDGVPSMPSTGYSNYGSVGGYVVNGTVPGQPATLSVGDASVTEGNAGTATLNFPVAVSYAVNVPIVLSYRTADGTATSPADYAAASGTITIPPGSTSAKIPVTVNGDTLNETDETLQVQLTGSSYGAIAQNSATGTIVNDDFPSLSIGNTAVLEQDTGASNATFTLTLSAPSVQTVTANYNTADSGATAGKDYTFTSGTVSFPPGQVTQTILVPVLGDKLNEGDETFVVNLTNVQHATVAAGRGVGTITDDDPPPSVSINDVIMAEGNNGASNASFTVGLSAPSAKTVQVNWATADGTATAGLDYTAQVGTPLSFAPGQTSKSVIVPVLGDVIPEADETFSVNLSVPLNCTLADAQGVGTIADDDSATLSVSDPTVVEGNAGTVNLAYAVTLSALTSNTVQVNYATGAAGSFPATSGTDYASQSGGTLTFLPGETTKTVNVPVNGDLLDEENETVGLNLSSPLHATIAKSQGVGTIMDDDATPALSINDVSAAEGNAGTTPANFTVSLSAASGRTVTVQYVTAGGSAQSGADFVAQPLTTLTLAPGTTSQTLAVPVVGDLLDEANETFTVTLSGAVNATIARGTGLGTIADNDTAQLKVNDPTVTEGNSGTVNLAFTVQLTGPSVQIVTVTCATAPTGTFPATAGVDYTALAATTLTFTPGQTSKTVNVAVRGDVLSEENETVALNLSAPTNATVLDAVGVGTILDDDAMPALSINDVTTPEGDSGTTTATFKVTLSAASGRTVTVKYATANGTATSGSDYTALPLASLTFAPGTTTQTLTVSIIGDTVTEADENYSVNLSGAVNAVYARSQGLGTITNDDIPSLAVDDPSVLEGNSGTSYLVYTVSLSRYSSVAVKVTCATAPYGVFPATAGVDYTALPATTLTFGPGVMSNTVLVPVLGDLTDENNETLALKLSSPTNAILSKATGIGTITNDDAHPRLTISDTVATEGNPGSSNLATFTLSLAPASGRTVTVSYATGPFLAGSYPATSGVDYTAVPPTTLIFTPGETTKTITVPLIGDALDEDDETFAVNLSSPSNVTIAEAQAVGTIKDDDASPNLTIIDPAPHFEGDSGRSNFTFTATLSAVTARTVKFSMRAQGGTAQYQSDYLTQVISGTIAPGTTTGTLSFPVEGDTLSESDETVTFYAWANVPVPKPYANQLVILNDDVSQLSVSDPSISEGSSGVSYLVYTVTQSLMNTQPVTVRYATANTGTFPATAGLDYTALPGATLILNPGQMSKTVTVSVPGDTLDEENETVGLVLSSPTNATIAKGLGVGTILNDDVAPTVSIDNVTKAEGNGGTSPATFTVKLSKVSGRVVTLHYATQQGTALANQDYYAASGNLTFAAGTVSQTLDVPVIGDTVIEPSESFSVNLSSVAKATVANGTGTCTITNDDLPQLTENDPVVVEGNAGNSSLVYTVSLSAPAFSPVTVKYSTSPTGTFPATPVTDYTPLPTTLLTFAPGETSKTIAVPVVGDLLNEFNETLGLNLFAPTNATISKSFGVGTIVDDDAVPTLDVKDCVLKEGNSGTTPFQFTVTLAAASGKTVTVMCATADASAFGGKDYVALPPTLLTFAPGTTSQTVTVLVNTNLVGQPDREFLLRISNATNGLLGRATGIGTITDDDISQISVDDPSILEGNSGTTYLIFTVKLSVSNSQPVTVQYATGPTGTFPATAGVDYTALSPSTLTFAAGQTSKQVTVRVAGDMKHEDNETVGLNLTAPTNATIAKAPGTGTIIDDDAVASLRDDTGSALTNPVPSANAS